MTQSDRFAARFAVLAQKKEGAFVPFVNLCDPTPEISSQILEALAAGGADTLELGIPFSDPCADGPVIEASAQRALAAGSTTAKCLGIIKAFRAKHPDIPVSLMLYVNLVKTSLRPPRMPALMLCLSLTFRFQCAKPNLNGTLPPKRTAFI